MKKKLIEALEWMGILIGLLVIYAIDTVFLKTEIFLVCCVLIGNSVICVSIMIMCEETFKGIIKFTKKRWRKSENGI
ncbi:hypothetical protein [Clostridium beijerinckii]|uniref:Uncharacterized protein n=1 Tax=Clostridium beijerinckii TaxID=1520 RepID=A0AAW3W4U3_CLOBE|nr:hypothetical protein [Clostridium beijerinckii]MBC2456599.1 hypothetical protein [Clostridium beijerinckii]MBC2473925.1 hypothetical protein [Clostridium beijerinckii]NOV63289.1 F0F1-type ATP synthase assembly protein I [Clostridium beijerinckii]NOV69748.1 F0F1-type ATP synthase assembly protein I [Clostridium beijerinckii]NOW31345.1 F0F1-type ATP synthase assembly protein I [Clostridium beijerinckii]